MFHGQQVLVTQQPEPLLLLLRRTVEASRRHMVWRRVGLALQIVDQPAVFPRLEVVQRGQHMTKIRQSLLISVRMLSIEQP
jgi:hypothetical protein